MIRNAYAWLTAVGTVMMCAPVAMASPNLVTNGSFSNSTALYAGYGANLNAGSVGSSGLPGWGITNAVNATSGQNASLPFEFLAPATSLGSSTTGGAVYYTGSPIQFWSGPGATPDGGTAVSSDAVNLTSAIYQTVSGLNVGQSYTLSFYQATMEATQGSGSFNAAWNVYFGTGAATNAYSAPTATGSTMVNPGGSYSPWNLDTLTFTATAASETLSFFATANGNSNPPFLLLDGVSLTQSAPAAVPEPASLALLGAGLAGFAFLARRRARSAGLG